MEFYEDLQNLAVQHGIKGKKLNKVRPVVPLNHSTVSIAISLSHCHLSLQNVL